jgi:succinate dehydrogenase/fumarate reductase flavoprotein subunit
MEKRVIVIGAGLAGMMAAYAAQADGVEVLLIDKGPIGLGTNTALANGVFACPTSGYEAEDYVKDTLQVGRRINNIEYVKRIAREAPGAMALLKTMGLDLKERKGQFFVPLPQPDVVPGRILVKTVAQSILALNKVSVLRNFYVTGLLLEERMTGIRGFDEQGKEIVLSASAVILATGGGGAIYLRNDNQKSTMGQGYALAAKAGLSLWDMEFVQFYPLVLNEPRLPSMIVYPPYPDELRLVNAAGQDLLEKWQVDNINKAAITKRDEFSVLLYEEGLKTPVYLDCRQLPEATREKQLSTLFKKVRFDFQHKPVAVSPAVHFFMGGIRVDAQGQTDLPGVFACGEIVWGFHGANRRGGNALTECAVMGNIVGKNAALFAKNQTTAGAFKPEPSPAWNPGEGSAMGRLRELRLKLRETAWQSAGIKRSASGLQKGLKDIGDLQIQAAGVAPQSVEERRQKEDLLSGILVTRAILTASQARQESRGSFIRQEFPQEDDQHWLKNSCLTLDSGGTGFSLSHKAV